MPVPPDSTTRPLAARRRAALLVFAGIFVAVLLASIGFAIHRDRSGPLQVTVLVVDGHPISMGYFVKRVFLAGREPLVVLNELASQEIVREAAPKPPFNIDPTKAEFDKYLYDLARGRAGTLSEAEFAEWERQQINESRLTAAEFRDVMRMRLVSDRMTDFLFARMPTVAEQVRLSAIRLPTKEGMATAMDRLAAGEDFAAVARDVNQDPKLKESGGDLGWYTRGELEPNFAAIVFDQLAVGGISKPFALDERGFTIVKLEEKVAAREIGDKARLAIKATLLDKWAAEEFPAHKIEFRGFTGGYDSDTDAWVRQQVKAMTAAAPGPAS